jgi:hypothetical protein
VRFHLDPAVRGAWLEGGQAVARQAVGQIAPGARAAWACSVVASALPALDGCSEVRTTAERASRLADGLAGEADALFRALRYQRLAVGAGDVGVDAVLALAELACKVAFNTTGPKAPFDARSDVSLVLAAAEVARCFPALEDALWDAVCRRVERPGHTDPGPSTSASEPSGQG